MKFGTEVAFDVYINIWYGSTMASSPFGRGRKKNKMADIKSELKKTNELLEVEAWNLVQR